MASPNTILRNRLLSRARTVSILVKSQSHIRKSRIRKSAFIKALENTGGVKALIAKKLGVSRLTVITLLQRPDWADMRELWNDEVEAGIDDAENCIRIAINNHVDMATATMNARWLLSKIRKERFGDESKTVIEGGPTPIRTMNLNVDVTDLRLPNDVKRQILEALDKREAEEKQKMLEAETVLNRKTA